MPSKSRDLYPLHTAAVGEQISKRINELMAEKEWSKANLASALGVHSHSVKDWLTGEANYSLSTIVSLERVLGGKIIEIIKTTENV